MKRLRSCFKSRLGNGRRGVEGKLFSGDGRQSRGGVGGVKVHLVFVRSEPCNRTSPHRRSSIHRSSTERRVQPALPQSPSSQRSPQPPVPFLLHPQVLLPTPPPPPSSPRKDVGGRGDFECCTHPFVHLVLCLLSAMEVNIIWWRRRLAFVAPRGSPLYDGVAAAPAGACRFRVWLCL